jgi:tripartite-type tricarboxylate transporter receptor subunit TctC
MLGRLLLAAVLALSPAVHAKDYPDKPIRIIVPFPPGATTDILARIVGQKLWAKWGQPVVVESRAGAGGNMGAEVVFKAEPDGYTLLTTPPSPLVINKRLYARLAYDPEAFAPVTVIGAVPTILVVHPKVSANSVQELIAFAKANPDRLNYASQGSGGTAHLTAEMFKSAAGVSIVHVPYKGAAPALTDLLAGQVDMMFANFASALQPIRAGQLRALGIASVRRNGLLPNVPTMSESMPGFVSLTWVGVVAPPQTPPEIANTLSAAIAEAMKLPDVAKRMADLSVEPIGNTPAEMAVFLREEVERWGGVIRSAGARAD